ncbi:Trihelix transcription factor ASR3 [Bienertia sinuspersici]
MSKESASNGTQNSVLDDKSRRHPRWTRQETLTLIQAKEIIENSPHKGRKINSLSSSSMENTEPKWVMISTYCKKQGVKRSPAQCRKRWSNLLGDFKKVKSWESKLEDKGDSFWGMRNDLRKENKLPVSFDVEVFKVLEGRENGAVGVVSPLPLQAVAAVSEGGDDECCEEEEVAEEEVEEEMVNGGEREVLEGKDDVLTDVKDTEQKILVLEWKEAKKTADNVAEKSPVENFCSSEPYWHESLTSLYTDTEMDNATEEPEPGISNWDSQENKKRRRLSTDDRKANCTETQILKVLEENNKLLNAQLDIQNKNFQLDREQRKEIKDALVATLGKLSDVLMKIAEKL